MNVQTVLSTDLITPLGAYLRLRGGDRAELPRSVERGRLGRHSFVGTGSRFVDFAEAEAARAGRRLPRLRPRGDAGTHGRAPGQRPDLPESRFVVADTLISSTTCLAWRRSCGATRRHRGAAQAPFDDAKTAAAEGGQHAVPQAGSSTSRSSRRSATSARATHSRSSSPSAPSGRRRPRRRPLQVTPTRQSVALPLPAGAGRARTRRILAGDAGQGRTRIAELNPIAGDASG